MYMLVGSYHCLERHTHTSCNVCMAIMGYLSAWSAIACPAAECHTASKIQSPSLVSYVLRVSIMRQHIWTAPAKQSCNSPAFSLWEQADQVGQLQQQCLSCPLLSALIAAVELPHRMQKPLRRQLEEPVHKHTHSTSGAAMNDDFVHDADVTILLPRIQQFACMAEAAMTTAVFEVCMHRQEVNNRQIVMACMLLPDVDFLSMHAQTQQYSSRPQPRMQSGRMSMICSTQTHLGSFATLCRTYTI